MSAELAPADRWAELAARFRVRDPAVDRTSMLHGVGHGVCLEPLLAGRSEVWFDETLEPRAGDLVLVEYTNDWMQRLLRAVDREPPVYRATWGEQNLVNGQLLRVAAKVYDVRAGVPWIVWKDGAVPLRPHIGQVVGVARHIEIDGRPAYGSVGQRRTRWRWAPSFTFLALAILLWFLGEVIYG